MKYAYQVNPRIPVRGLKGHNAIVRPTVIDLEKDEVIFCLRFGNVYRRFSQDLLVKVTRSTINELHVPADKYKAEPKKFAPNDSSVIGNPNVKPEEKKNTNKVSGGFTAIDPRLEKKPDAPVEKPVVEPKEEVKKEPESEVKDEKKAPKIDGIKIDVPPINIVPIPELKKDEINIDFDKEVKKSEEVDPVVEEKLKDVLDDIAKRVSPDISTPEITEKNEKSSEDAAPNQSEKVSEKSDEAVESKSEDKPDESTEILKENAVDENQGKSDQDKNNNNGNHNKKKH